MHNIPSLDESLPMILYRSLDRVLPPYRELFNRYALTEQQWRILRVLWDKERTTTTELSKRTLLPQASLVGIVSRLKVKQLVDRMPCCDDRRVIYVILTDHGRSLGQTIAPEVAAINRKLKSSLSATEWEKLQTILDKLNL